jgi:hypothetical protein
MFIAIALMNIVHPGRVLRGEGSGLPAGPMRKDGKAAKKTKKETKRAEKEKKALNEER